MERQEHFEIQKSVHYWAGRLIGHKQANNISEEIIEAIKNASLQCEELKRENEELKAWKESEIQIWGPLID